jgi:rRNA maturation endonuclease Nob1
MREVMPEVCWMALYICLTTNKTPIQSINSLVADPYYSLAEERLEVAEQDADMVVLKQNLTYEQIGELYNMNANAVYRRIKRFKERDRLKYSYYCDHCGEEPLSLKPGHRCGKCGNEVRKVSDIAKRVADGVRK